MTPISLQTGQTLQALPQAQAALLRPTVMSLRGITLLRVHSTMVLMGDLVEEVHHMVVVEAAAPLLVDQAMASGKTADMFLVQSTNVWSVSCLAFPTTLRKLRAALIFRTMTISPLKHLVPMFQSLASNSQILLSTTTCSQTSSLHHTRLLRRCKSTPSPSSWEVET